MYINIILIIIIIFLLSCINSKYIYKYCNKNIDSNFNNSGSNTNISKNNNKGNINEKFNNNVFNTNIFKKHNKKNKKNVTFNEELNEYYKYSDTYNINKKNENKLLINNMKSWYGNMYIDEINNDGTYKYKDFNRDNDISKIKIINDKYPIINIQSKKNLGKPIKHIYDNLVENYKNIN